MDILEVQIKHESFRLNSYFNETLLEINNSEVNSLPSSFRYHKGKIEHVIERLFINFGIYVS